MKQKFTRCAALMALSLGAYVHTLAAPVQIGDLFYELNAAQKVAQVMPNASYRTINTVTIPATVTYENEEYTVTKIGEQAFQNCAALTKLTLPQTIDSIGKWGFCDCSGLTDVAFPESLQFIGQSAFSGCKAFVNLILPDDVQTLETHAFANCTKLVSVVLPKNMTELGDYAFRNDSKLTTITWPDNLQTIKLGAFHSNSALTEIVLPEGLTSLGNNAFAQCSSLKKAVLPNSLTAVPSQLFYECRNLADVTLGNAVTYIGDATFYNNKGLAALNLPATVDFIDRNAFYGSGFTEFVLPEKVTVVSANMLYDCQQLTSVTLHENVTEIGTSVFQNCVKLPEITIPSKVTVLGNNLFNQCKVLKKADIPAGVTSIGKHTFRYCYALESVEIPAGVTEIGEGAFMRTYALNEFKVDPANTSYKAVDGILYTSNMKTLVSFPGGIVNTAIKVPEGVTKIESYAFNGYDEIPSVELPESLKVIGTGAFAYCSGLTSIDIPANVDSICSDAYNNMFGSKVQGNVIIPATAVHVGWNSFYGNSGISDIVILSSNPGIDQSAFGRTGVVDFILPEGIEEVGLTSSTTSKPFTIMDYNTSLKSVSLPSTMKQLRPFGYNCNLFTTLYSWATEAPELVGAPGAITSVKSIYVPVGSKESYTQAWGSVYTGAKIYDVLPTAPVLTEAEGSMTLSWKVYSFFSGTPSSYELTFFNGTQETTVTLDAAGAVNGTSTEAPLSGALSYTLSATEAAADKVVLKGFAPKGQTTLMFEAELNGTSGIEDVTNEATALVSVSGNTLTVAAPAKIYDLTGALVAETASSVTLAKGVYVVTLNGKSFKVKI